MADDLREQLQSFGVEIVSKNDPDELLQVGLDKGIPVNELVDEWVGFSHSHNQLSLNKTNIERFSAHMSSKLRKQPSHTPRSSKTTPKSQYVYTKDNVHLLFSSSNEMEYQEEDDFDVILTGYGVQPSEKKVNKRPNTTPVTPDPKTKSFQVDESPDLMSHTPTAKYSLRQNSGKVIISHNQLMWVESTGFVNIHSNERNLMSVPRHMYQTVKEKRKVLAHRLFDLSQRICMTTPSLGVSDVTMTTPLATATTEACLFVGRVLCEGEGGKLNHRSCILEGFESFKDNKRYSLIRVTLDIPNNLETNCSLFPGQIIAVQGTLNHSGVLLPTKIYDTGSLPSCMRRKSSIETEGLSIIMAAGPFTVSDSLSMSALTDLLTLVNREKPSLLILIGPFVDNTHSAVKNFELLEDCDNFQSHLIAKVFWKIHEVCKATLTRVLVIPSGRDLCHQWSVYPQPPYTLYDKVKRSISDVISLSSDPSNVTINNINIGLTSTDILFHLSSSTLFVGSTNDRMARLASHLLQQQSFYPLYPPFQREEAPNKDTPLSDISTYIDNLPEVNLDLSLAYGNPDNSGDGHAHLREIPDILVLPSNLKPFVKVIGNCLCVNPGHITRKAGGGTFVKMSIPQGHVDIEHFGAEIVYI